MSNAIVWFRNDLRLADNPALQAALPFDVRALVERQRQGAQRNHDEVRALRDSFRAAS